MSSLGSKKLAALTDTAKGAKQLPEILQAVRDSRIDIPKIKPVRTSQAAHFAKKKKTVDLPDPSQYQLVPGTLRNQDGSPTPLTTDFNCKATGYMPILPQQAVPWLHSTSTLSPDELVLLIFGDSPIETSLGSISLTLPFSDPAGQQVLIACTMVQFGNRKVVQSMLDPHRITMDQLVMMSLTLWQSDWGESAWQLALQNPFKFIKAMPGAEEAIINMWGKSYGRGKNLTTQ